MKFIDHPERMADEVFLNYLTKKQFDKLIWRTKRFGKKVYDKNDIRVTNVKTKPVFVKRNEFLTRGIYLEY
jgi:hypothetical protein